MNNRQIQKWIKEVEEGTYELLEPEDIKLGIERVNRGMKLLDEKKPNWLDDVKVSKLDMSHAQYCILGQTTGDYVSRSAMGFLGVESHACLDKVAADYGFIGDFDILDRLWIEALKRRARTGKRVFLNTPSILR